MSAHVSLNLLNELGKVIKCEACRTCCLFFATSLINFNDTGSRMLDSIDHYDIKITLKSHFWRKKL